MFTDVEGFLWQGAGPATFWLTATQDTETATDATWSDGRAARDGSAFWDCVYFVRGPPGGRSMRAGAL